MSGHSLDCDPAPIVSAIRVPGFEIERLLGKGGFGLVYSARSRSPGDGVRVAIKVGNVGDPDSAARIHDEAVALRAVGAPHVPAVRGEGVLESGAAFVVMDLIEASTLKDLLGGDRETVSPALFRDRAFAVIDALAAVHAAGWAHGDLKPENVFMCPGGPGTSPGERERADTRAVLIDLGLACRFGAERGSTEGEWAGSYAGTPEYMAPEVCEGASPSERSDIYSMGVILYEMLTGSPPFQGTGREVQQAHLACRPLPPSSLAPISEPVEEVVLRCLAKDPAQRFSSVPALRGALEDAWASGMAVVPKRECDASGHDREESDGRASRRRSMGVVFFESDSSAAALQSVADSAGGALAHLEGRRCGLVFEEAQSENPVRRAWHTAELLIERGVTDAVLVDLAPVLARTRAGGGTRYLSTAFLRAENYPDSGTSGVIATARAYELIPDVFARSRSPGEWSALRTSRGSSPAPPAGPLLGAAASDSGGRRCIGGPGVFTRIPDRSAESVAPMVGRKDALEALVGGAGDTLRQRQPGLAMVTAGMGLGKSRLSAELERELRAAHPTAEMIVLAAAEPVGRTDETIRRVLRFVFDLPSAPGFRPPDGGRSLLESAAYERWPAVALALGWISSEAPEVRSLGAAPGVLRSMVVRAGGDALRRRAGARPVLLLLDDAHYADEATLDLLEYAALSEAWAPLWVCLFARPALEAARPLLGRRAARRQRLKLAPLDTPEAVELCRLLLRPAENVPAKALELLARRTQGNPLLLVELVRGLKRDGLVRRSGDGAEGEWFLATEELESSPDLPLVDWLAARELAAMPDDLAAHARVCALLAPEFGIDELAGILRELERGGGGSESRLDAAVGARRLVGTGLLVGRPQGAVGFRHSLVRSAVARTVSDEWSGRVHLAAWRFYSNEPALPESVRLARRAHHALPAGLREEAAGLSLELADRARSHHAYLEAESMYSRVLELHAGPEDFRRLAAYRGRGLMRYRLGRYSDSLRDFEEARHSAERLNDPRARIEILLDEATALDWTNEYGRSRVRLEEARASSPGQGSGDVPGGARTRGQTDPVIEARLLMGAGRSLFRDGNWREAAAALESAAAAADRLGDEGYETLVVSLLLLGVVLPLMGRIDEAEEVMGRAVALCESRGDQLHLGAALNNRRNLRVARGRLQEALWDQQASMRIGRELGMVGTEYVAEYNLGELLYQAGDTEAAEQHIQRAVKLERRHPAIADRPLALLLRARKAAFLGREAEARADLECIRIRQGAGEARTRGTVAAPFSESEQVLFDMVDLATRDASGAEWEALSLRSGRVSLEQEPIEVLELRGLAAARHDRIDEARAAYRAALEAAASVPNVMEPRLAQGLGRMLSAAPRPLERTARALAAGCAIGMLIAATNVLMGLKTGWWESGSITASILAFTLLRPFGRKGPRSTDMETNLAQTTAASVGAMPAAAGLLGALPALALLGFTYPAWGVVLWGAALGSLGVLLAMTLRKSLLEDPQLPFPTGLATAEVISALHAAEASTSHGPGAGAATAGRIRALFTSGMAAMAFAWFRDGRPGLIPAVTAVPGSIAGVPAASLTLGMAWSPMMIGAGILVGPRNGLSVLLGGVLAWGFIAPALVGTGMVLDPGYAAFAGWLLWPGAGLMIGAGVASLTRRSAGHLSARSRSPGEWSALRASRGSSPGEWSALRASRGSSPEPPAEPLMAAIRELRLMAGTANGTAAAFFLAIAAVLVVGASGWWLFALHPLQAAVGLVLLVVLGIACARAAGQTDVAPIGQMGQLTQAASGLLRSGELAGGVAAGSIVAGGAAQTTVSLWSFAAGRKLGASARVQGQAQLVGVAFGALVSVPIYLLVTRAYVLGSAELPAPGAIQWKALSELISNGAGAVPPGAGLAALGGLLAAVCLDAAASRVPTLPSPGAVGIGFIAPAHYAAAIALGSIVPGLYRRLRPARAEIHFSTAGAGAIAGESVVGLAVAVLIVTGIFTAG